MFSISKIPEAGSHEMLKEFLSSRLFLPIFFYSPYTLSTWLMHQEKSLYIATLGDQKALILHKEKNNDLRFLFSSPSDALLKGVMSHFDPSYAAFNDVMGINDEPPDFVRNTELAIDVDFVANLSDKDIHKAYDKCRKRHPVLKIERYAKADRDSVRSFLEEWAHSRSEEKNKYAKIENDNRFLDLYADDAEVRGIVVRDGHKIIAISFACPSMDGQTLGVINKCLRGYVQLGIFIFVERARLMQSLGFKRMHIGSINNDFKKGFIPSGTLHETCAREIFRKPDFVTHGPYLDRLF